ncbi:MAG TPA: F0F1 ATP synthase subunit epsilon [Pirellulales bacterium]|nr:F0F1 ATP synthase subunit epsilon [Pirellulales bacterium]
MTADQLDFEILVPDGVVARLAISSLEAADASGRFGIWPNHAPFFTVLAPCVLIYRSAAGKEEYAAVDGGVLLVEKGRASIVSREAFTSPRLDEVAGKAAALLAERRAQEHLAGSAFAQLEASLARQIGKLERKK